MTRLALGLTLALGACQIDNNAPQFGTGGGTGEYGDDTGDEPEEGAPLISTVTASFSTISGYHVLDVEVYYTDAEDDVQDGIVYMDMVVDGQPRDTEEIPINGTYARIEDGAVMFSLSGKGQTSIDTSVDYSLDIALEDRAGNLSNTEGVDVDAL